jgi:hypothetical protein
MSCGVAVSENVAVIVAHHRLASSLDSASAARLFEARSGVQGFDGMNRGFMSRTGQRYPGSGCNNATVIKRAGQRRLHHSRALDGVKTRK